MILTKSGSVMLALLAMLAFACKQDPASAAAQAKQEQDEALKALEKSLEGLKEGSQEVVDFRILKEALPEKLSGMNRTSHTGQKSGIAGLSISSAEAVYEDGDSKITITLLDTGGLGVALGAMAAWSKLEIDQETDEGYERTTMIDGKKAIEKYNRKTREGEISVIASDRFIVSVKGSQISEQDLRNAISKIKVNG
jgi:hypothetical protein